MKISRVIPLLGVVTVMGTTGVMSLASGDSSTDTAASSIESTQNQASEQSDKNNCICNGNGKEGKGGRGKGKGQKGNMSERPELTEEEKAEMKARRDERLAQDLADGKITQEEYEEMINSDFQIGRGNRGERPELTEEEKAEMKAKRDERLAQDLAYGKITQEEYDERINCEFDGENRKYKGRGFDSENSESGKKGRMNRNINSDQSGENE